MIAMSATLSVRKIHAAPVRLDGAVIAGAAARALRDLVSLIVPARPALPARLVRDAGLPAAATMQGLDWTVGEYRRLPL
jgi:hypothetical protein